jgi:polygalacturonase
MWWAVLSLLVSAQALLVSQCDIAKDCMCPNDGRTDGSSCIRACIRSCHEKGPDRATVIFSSGVFLTGAFNLTSNMTLVVETGATVLATTDPAGFPVVPALPSYGTCRDDGYPLKNRFFRHQAFISGWNIENVDIIGNGTIDGQVRWCDPCSIPLSLLIFFRELFGGRSTLIAHWTTDDRASFSPCLVAIYALWDCTSVTARFGPSISTARTTCMLPTLISALLILVLNRLITPVKLTIPAPNTDGIDPDSAKNVLIENCVIQVGDDAIAIKSGMDYAGRQYNRSTENVLIRNSWYYKA